jgi:hypothetical protein
MLAMVISSIGVFGSFELNAVLLLTPCGKSPVHYRQDSAPCPIDPSEGPSGTRTFNEA